MPDSDFPHVARARSYRSTTKVNCETLILSSSDAYMLPCEYSQVGYLSDDEKDARKIHSDAKTQHVASDRWLSNPTFRHENTEKPSHGSGIVHGPKRHGLPELRDAHVFGNGRAESFSSAVGPQKGAFLQSIPRALCGKSDMSEPGSTGWRRRSRRRVRGTVHRSSGLVPHSGPIMLPIGSHSGPLNNVNNTKCPVLVKASSIIPSNTISARMNALVIKDPSSPKVTCLGRVRVKQQQQGGRCSTADKAPGGVLDNGNRDERQPPTCWMTKPKRRGKKDSTDISMHQKTRERSDSSGHTSMANHRIERAKITSGQDALKNRKLATRPTEEPEGKANLASKCIPLKEHSRRSTHAKIANDEGIDFSRQYEQKCTEEVSAASAPSPEVDVCINLSRFGSMESLQRPEVEATRSSTSESRSHRIERRTHIKESFGQAVVPPRNALLLMRSSRAKDVGRSEQSEDNSNVPPPPNALLLMRNSKPKDYGEARQTFASLNLQSSSFPRVKKSMRRQTSFPDEKASLWQRRAFRKPDELDIRRSKRSEGKQPTST